MALFGGNFAQGFATGLANRVAKEIDEDMDKTEDNISRLATLRLERAARNEEKNATLRKEKESELKNMVSQLEGSVDAAQYLIDNFSYDRAKEIAKTLSAQQQTLGLSPLKQIGLSERTGKSATLEQLVQSNTPFTTLAPLDSVKGQVAVGFGKLFGGEDAAARRLEAQSDAEITAAGIEMPSGQDALKTMPPALQGNLKEYMLGRLGTPKEEAQRLLQIANNFEANNKSDEAKALRNEAEALMLVEKATSLTTSGEQKWKRTDVDAAGNNIGEALALNNGINAKKGPTGVMIDADTEDALRQEYTIKQGYLTSILDTYVKSNGVDAYAKGMQTIKTAIANNSMIRYIPPVDDDGIGTFEVDADTPLFTVKSSNTKQGNLKLPQTSGASSNSTTPQASGAGAAAVNAPSAAQTIVDQLLQTTPGTPKANALKNILLRKHPNTPIPAGY